MPARRFDLLKIWDRPQLSFGGAEHDKAVAWVSQSARYLPEAIAPPHPQPCKTSASYWPISTLAPVYGRLLT